jgi:hypothetical protein
VIGMAHPEHLRPVPSAFASARHRRDHHIDVATRGDVRRAKLHYLRGKKAKIKEKR